MEIQITKDNFKEEVKEIGKIKWPSKGDLATNSVQVVVVTAFFALFFYLCQFVISILLSMVGGL